MMSHLAVGYLCLGALLAVVSSLPAGASGLGTSDRPDLVVEKTLRPGGSPNAIAWSPDGKLLAIADTLNTRITIWDYATGKQLHRINKTYFGLGPLSFTPDGRYVVTSAVSPKGSDNLMSFSFIDVSTGQVARNAEGPDKNPTDVSINVARQIAVSASAPFAATVTKNGNFEYLNFINAEDWSTKSSHQALDIAAALAPDPVNSLFAVLYVDGKLAVWDAAADRPVASFKAHTYSGAALAFSADGKSLASSEGLGFGGQTPDPDAIRVWDTATWQMIAKTVPAAGEDFRARSLSFSSDGRYLASLNYDGKARLWDGKSLSLVEVIDDSEKGGIAIAFAPDSQHLAIARNDDVTVVRIDKD